MGTFNDGDSGSSIRTKINTAIEKTEGTSAITTIDVNGGAIDGVTLGTNSAVTEAQVDNININGNTISSTDTNGNVTIDPNGTGITAVTGPVKPTTYRETVGTESSGTLDLSTGNVFSHAPSTNVTYVFSNPPSSGTAFGFTLKVSPSATITQTWPASVDWAGGSAPTATASGETDVFTFYTQDGGTTYYGFQAGNAMA